MTWTFVRPLFAADQFVPLSVVKYTPPSKVPTKRCDPVPASPCTIGVTLLPVTSPLFTAAQVFPLSVET